MTTAIQETITPLETDYAWLADSFNRRPTKRRNLTIAEYAETTIIPTGKYRGVMFKNNRAPYMIKPMELLSPQSSIQEVRLLWPAQSGKTTVGEMMAMYYIDEIPSEILYVGSNATAARKWAEKRITPRAIRAGIEFRAQTENKASRRSGDTIFSKEFDGGNLDLASALSAASLASETKRVVIADETDRWKLELGAEGLTWDVMHARTQAWGDQKKILAISTPTTYEMSMIWPLYEEGTQEEFFVPCPICSKKQILKLSDGGASGLTWETEAGKIKEKYVYYIFKFRPRASFAIGHTHDKISMSLHFLRIALSFFIVQGDLIPTHKRRVNCIYVETGNIFINRDCLWYPHPLIQNIMFFCLIPLFAAKLTNVIDIFFFYFPGFGFPGQSGCSAV